MVLNVHLCLGALGGQAVAFLVNAAVVASWSQHPKCFAKFNNLAHSILVLWTISAYGLSTSCSADKILAHFAIILKRFCFVTGLFRSMLKISKGYWNAFFTFILDLKMLWGNEYAWSWIFWTHVSFSLHLQAKQINTKRNSDIMKFSHTIQNTAPHYNEILTCKLFDIYGPSGKVSATGGIKVGRLDSFPRLVTA